MKFYEFRYASKSKKNVASILNILSCFTYPFFALIIFLMFLSALGTTDYMQCWMYIAFILVAFIISIIFVVKYVNGLKGIILYDDHLEIVRNYITDFHPVPNFSIYFNDIKLVYNSRENIRLNKFKARKALVTGGDLTYYVDIILYGGKEFYFPVENQDEFVRELLERINNYREENNLKPL